MSARNHGWAHSRAKQHWHAAFSKVAARNLQRKYEFAKVDPELNAAAVMHIYWRLGFHLFYSKQYFEAIGVLETVCRNGKSEEEVAALLAKRAAASSSSGTAGARAGSLLAAINDENEAEADEEEEILHGNYHVHMLAGRCSVQLFLKTSAHYHLENAYKHYSNCIENMSVPDDWQKKSLLRLPVALHEMGHLLEHYGALHSAIDLYTRVMTDYPDYRRYFDVMYRSALVGRHLADALTKPDEIDAMLNKCIDMLQFLLEALPSTIDDAHIILLYGRTLDKSRDPAVRFRAQGVYKNLFEHLRDAKRCNADTCASYRDWGETPMNWFALGSECGAQGEPLLAKDAYEMFVQKLESKRLPGKDMSSLIDAATAMKLAHNFASFQHYTEAARFAEVALSHNRLDKDVRSCLSRWSKIHAAKLAKEASAVNTLHEHWRTRVWSVTYRTKLKTHTVTELEDSFAQDRFDPAAREGLAYFSRDKWRARFMFETQCAVRLQRFIRGRIKIWKAQTRLRQRYLNRAAVAYRNYCKTPFAWDVRDEIKAVTGSKHCPKKHIINKVIDAIRGQDVAVLVVQRAYTAHRGRLAIYDGIARTRQKKEDWLRRAATTIQCLARKHRARRRVAAQRKWHAKRSVAAAIIQRYVRWRNSTFQHAVTRVVRFQQRRHIEARRVFVYVFSYYARRYIKRKHEAFLRRQRQLEEQAERDRRNARANFLHRCSRILSRFFRLLASRRLSAMARQRLAARRAAPAASSHLATSTFNKTFTVRPDNTIKQFEAVALDPAARYEPPGVSQSSRQFLRALEQTALYCRDDVSAADCMMIATVLRHPACRLQRLVLHDVRDAQNAAFEFDLLPAIGRCRALRTVQLLGGAYSAGFLHGLVRDVQSENPRIKEILLERVVPALGPGRGAAARALCDTAARLVMDYFNYSVPGLSALSLHGCTLGDEDLGLLAQGVAVSSSLRSLAVSLNALTDAGLLQLLDARASNRKTILTVIDARHNLVSCGRPLRAWLDVCNSVAAGAAAASHAHSQSHAHTQSHTHSQHPHSAAAPESDADAAPLDVLLAWNMVSRPYPDTDEPGATKGHRVLLHTSDVKPVSAADFLGTADSGGRSSGPVVGAGGGAGAGLLVLPGGVGGPVYKKPRRKPLPKTDVSMSPKQFLATQSTGRGGGWGGN